MEPLVQSSFDVDLLAVLAEFLIWVAVGYFGTLIALPMVQVVIIGGLILWLLGKMVFLDGETSYEFMTGVAEVNVGGRLGEIGTEYYIPILLAYTPPTLGLTIGVIVALFNG